MAVDERDVLAVYADLFIQQWGRYAVQQGDGAYWLVDEPLTEDLLRAHLAGQVTLGTYLLDEAGCCRVAVFDADGENGLGVLRELVRRLMYEQDVWTVLEASRRGGHLWVFLHEPTPAQLVRAWLLPYAQAYGLELYPKQDSLAPGGCGSLIRLPLGVHRRSRGWYPFLQQDEEGYLLPVGQTRDDCLVWLMLAVHRVSVPLVVKVLLEERDRRNEERGELLGTVPIEHDGGVLLPSSVGGAIRAWCHTQDIRAVIGRYVALDRREVGRCPFSEHHVHGDLHPSFQVFSGNQPHWYCYTWGRAGDLFDFLCLYRGITLQEGWELLRQGTLLV